MTESEGNQLAGGGGWAPWAASWRPVILLVLGVSVLRVLYLAFCCPYTLVEDEAHYWEWSRHLDWSYYSKGPGVAWIIAASTGLFGDTELAVRLPAVLFSAVTALAIAGLARDATGDKRAGFFAAALFQLVPIYQGTSLLMTIDMPYAACWSLAAWAAWRGVMGGGRGAWAGLGLALAAGFVAKYTILLLIPGLAYFAWRSRGQRPPIRPGMVALAGGVAMLGLLPVVIWNAQRGWPTVHHLLGHLGVAGGDVEATQGAGGWHYSPRWTLEFLGSQLALAGPVLLLGLLSPVAGGGGRGRWFLMSCATPIVLFYLLVSFVAEPEGNWAMAGYLTLCASAGWVLVGAMDGPVRPPGVRFLWHAALVVGVITGLGALRLDLFAAGIDRWERWATAGADSQADRERVKERAEKWRRMIPMSRFMGADEMALHVARLVDELRRGGPSREPIVISQFYGRASLMAFYLPGHPVVYCSGSRMGGRKSQYDYWPDTDLADPKLTGASAVLLSDETADWSWGFDTVELKGKLDGDRKRNRVAFVGGEYRPK